jgi:DNA-binding transcriptional MerR regulator
MGLKVGEVAALAGVSVRTLHHYDRIGLLPPSERSHAGYRLYSDDDLVTLQQILFFREIGFALQEIGRIMHDPSFDRLEALRLQRRMLVDRSAQLRKMIAAVDKAIDGMGRGTVMDRSEMFEVFGDFDPARYEDEVQERWGHSEAYRESARRTASYEKQDWEAMKREADEINDRLAGLLDAGVLADDPRATEVAEQHRLMMDRWFYPCSHSMHTGLGEMYVGDARFKETYEKVRPGLAHFFREAIKANAARQAG